MAETYDSGRYHSIWLPDHMVSFWPDALWSPEYTDLATTSHSPHRHLDAMAVAGAVTALTSRVPIATSVVDTVRRHPAMLAQTALTLDHLSKGRFILGLGSGEAANTGPYGFPNDRPASRFEESLDVITRLWNTDGPVTFEGQFYRISNARLDTDLYNGTPPPIWAACSGPRMLEIAGRYVSGWWSAGARTPEEYASQLATLRASAERAGRDPDAIVPANIMRCIIGSDDEIAEMLEAPLIKSMLLVATAEDLRLRGHDHPMGPEWRGIQDFDPSALTSEAIRSFCDKVDAQMIKDTVSCGTPQDVAERFKGFCDAGMRVFRINDWSGMAGLKYAPSTPAKIRETEDNLMKLVG
jgi:phthiodiolone/phenolphthiodiolone dimycocerosates ketoreductase